MRWRSGPQNEVNSAEEREAAAASPQLPDEDEQDHTCSSSSHASKENQIEDHPHHLPSSKQGPSHGRLGSLSATDNLSGTLLPADRIDNNRNNAKHDEDIDDDDLPDLEPPIIVKSASEGLDDEDDEDDDDNDDPGADHAEPQTPVWKPQSQQSTCEFTHTISSYSQKRESGCKKAEYSATTVDEFGNAWRLIVYVNGNGRASNHHLSLFLQVADADDLPFGWKKAVSYVLTLEHPSGGNLGYSKRNPDKTFKLCPKAIDWGWSQFITSDRIQQEGYISSDSLTVRASVTVKSSSVSIDPDDAELYLKCAVEEGNALAVKDCLSQGAGVNCQFKDDLYTPLHTACSSSASSGSLEVLELLLHQGADGNACNKWRETPLLIAANNGHTAAVNALLKAGADPSLCSEAGWSALTFAAHKGYDDIVALLLKSGAPVNCRVTEDLSTPLHKACAGGKAGHLSAVKQLLENGADVHALNKWRETPLLTAANHGQAAAVEALLRAGGDPAKCTDTGWSPLSIAAYKGHDDVVRLLLEEGAPTEEADPTLSALLQAATKGLPDTVELLLRHGADHTVTTKKGDTALSILVEQNLIDAAVEMVSEYKASIPRCSRDRKKVQRARLLINLRVKQLQRDGMYNVSTDDETDEEEVASNSALHDESDKVSPNSGSKKKRKNSQNGVSRESAEAQARAAEEALLLELAEEETRAQKDEAAANSKRAKNQKKKERQRQQKLREEKEREERAAKERERERKLKEESERKAQELRQKQQREQEIREAEIRREEERARKAMEEIARQKEREEKEKRQREHAQRAREAREKQDRLAHSSNSPAKAKANGKGKGKNQHNSQKAVSPTPLQVAKASTRRAPHENKRGWETNATVFSHSQSVVDQPAAPVLHAETKHPVFPQNHAVQIGRSSPPSTVDTQRPHRVLSESPAISTAPATVADTAASSGCSVMELPSVAVYRQDKFTELLRRCSVARSHPSTDPLSVVDERTIKTVVHRWIVRAAHDKSTFLDPLIPSWTDSDFLTAFLQRQFIAESRKGVNASVSSPSGLIGMEALKEAGSAFATLCETLAKDLDDFKRKAAAQIAPDWTDSSINVTASEVRQNGLNAEVVIDWTGRAHAKIPATVFGGLSERYIGPHGRLLSSVFVMAKRYELMAKLESGTIMGFHLPAAVHERMAHNAAVSIELSTSPMRVYGRNSFFGIFPDVDAQFGALIPFGKEDSGSELVLLNGGGSVAGMVPFDSMISSLYLRKIVDLLERAEKERVPLSFVIFLHAECFRDPGRQPSINDLTVLEPRLANHQGSLVKCAEILPPGQHAYDTGEGKTVMCTSRSLFVLFQNDAGKARFPLNDASLLDIIRSAGVNVPPPPEAKSQPPAGYINGFSNTMPPERAPISPSIVFQDPVPSASPRASHFGGQHDFSSISGVPIGNNGLVTDDARKAPRRGRLFELIDDGEEDPINDVSGMLNLDNLNVSLFKNAPNQDVDIEAISLMGIGGAPLGDVGIGNLPGRSRGRFG